MRCPEGLFGERKALVGMVHVASFPGSPGGGPPLATAIEEAVRAAKTLAEAGFDAVLVENWGDRPYRVRPGPAVVAAMTRIVRAVVEAVDRAVGVNVLRNHPLAALAVADAAGATFIRVNVHLGVVATDQGLIEGRADRTIRMRRHLGADVAILADLAVKHGRSLTPAEPVLEAEELVQRGMADGLIVTGPTTGRPPDLKVVEAVVGAGLGVPCLIGSGMDAEGIGPYLAVADGAIVGTSLKAPDGSIDPGRAAALVRAAREGGG